MADVLIRGMEMPTNVFDCPLNSFGICNLAQDETNCDCVEDSRPEWCPLVSLPEGHGRLIDADALLSERGIGVQIAGWGIMFHESAIAHAPIIVPAEGGTDDA